MKNKISNQIQADLLERINKLIKSSDFLSHFTSDPELFLSPINRFPDKGDWQKKPISECKEPLIAFNRTNSETGEIVQLHKRIFAKPAYYKQGIKESIPIVYGRKAVALALLKYVELLPENYGIILYDGYRPIAVQQSLYDTQYKIEAGKPENRGLSPEEIETLTKTFVSLPSTDPTKPSTHNTGGAMDFSICDIQGHELNFGCNFDDFRSIANLAYFDNKILEGEPLTDAELEAFLHRRVLCNLATRVELQPYNGEWWHYDKNNQWDMKLSEALYGSVDLAKLIPDAQTLDIDDLIRKSDSLLYVHKKYLIFSDTHNKLANMQKK